MPTKRAEFRPHPLLRDGHLMTILPGFFPRNHGNFARSAHKRLFAIDHQTRLLAYCHVHDDTGSRPWVIVLHGLEGSADAPNVLGVSKKLFAAGLNVVRLNMRNCGGSEGLTPTLYNAGLSSDIHKVVQELSTSENASAVALVGFSLGGNIVLKAAAENQSPSLSFVAAISPSIDLEMAVAAIEKRSNQIYTEYFLRSLKEKLRAKAALYPDRFDASHLSRIKTIREFDDIYTAPDGGYGTAANYYFKASSCRVVNDIKVSGLIITASDDPIVPADMFTTDRITNCNIETIITKHGGHGGFVQHKVIDKAPFDMFWAENKVVEFACSQPGAELKG